MPRGLFAVRFEFANRDLEALYKEGPKAGRGKKVARRLPTAVVRAFFEVVALISVAKSVATFKLVPALHYHSLRGDRDGFSAMRLNRQYRLVVKEVMDESGEKLLIIEIVDYH